MKCLLSMSNAGCGDPQHLKENQSGASASPVFQEADLRTAHQRGGIGWRKCSWRSAPGPVASPVWIPADTTVLPD